MTLEDVAVLERQVVPDSSDTNWSGYRSRASLVARIQDDGYLTATEGSLMVEVPEGQAVGSVGYSAQEWAQPPYSRAWRLGIALLPERRGKGIGTAAQRALCDHPSRTTAVNRIEAVTSTTDVPEQQRALTAAGLTPEGILGEAAFHVGEVHDAMMFSVLRCSATGCGMRRGWLVLLFWRLLNPVMRPLAGAAPWWVLVETVGRKTGRRRKTPLAVGRLDSTGMWVIAVHGRRSSWVLNAEIANTVRYRHRLRWVEAEALVHAWDPRDVAAMSVYARSGPRVTADNPLLVQFQAVV